MKVTCYVYNNSNWMKIQCENSEEKERLSNLSMGVQQDLPDGSATRYIGYITETNYHHIADIGMTGVPETYEAFIDQVNLHEAEIAKQEQKSKHTSPSKETPSENSGIEPELPKMR